MQNIYFFEEMETPEIQKSQLNLSLEILLQMVLIMKVVPLRWIRQLPEQYQVNKFSVYNRVNNARTQEYIKISQDITGEKLLYLTPKGYKKATEILPAEYSYRRWTKDASRKATIYQEHHYILFRFFLDYLNKYQTAERILSDYDTGCLLVYDKTSKDVLKPDGIIRPKEVGEYYNLVCIEADTGTKSQTKLFDQILRYLIFAHNNFDNEAIEKVKVYFSFKSQNRLNSVFTFSEKQHKGNIFKFFRNRQLKFKDSKVKTNMPIEYILKVLKNEEVEFYAGVLNNGYNGFEKVNFLEKMKEASPKWERY